MKKHIIILFFLSVLSPFCKAQTASMLNGFVLSDLTIPQKEIKRGGPPRDGIPSIDRPVFLSADDAFHLNPEDQILGVEYNGLAKAYPIRILDRHEVVNDRFNGKKVAVTYCPLCGSGMAFEADDRGDFGVSGLLYNSDVLLYDRQSESLWSQIMGEAVSGPRSGKRLNYIQTFHTTWQQWLEQHPDTRALSENTGYLRDYQQSPYQCYESSGRLMFPVAHKSKALPAKQRVIGVEMNGQFRAYPFSILPPEFSDELGGKTLNILFNKKAKSATVKLDGEVYPSVSLYWFAWYAFHPETSVYGK